MIPLPYLAGAWALSLALAAGGAWIKATSLAEGKCDNKALHAENTRLTQEVARAETAASIARQSRIEIDYRLDVVHTFARSTSEAVRNELAANPVDPRCVLPGRVHAPIRDAAAAARDRLSAPATADDR